VFFPPPGVRSPRGNTAVIFPFCPPLMLYVRVPTIFSSMPQAGLDDRPGPSPIEISSYTSGVFRVSVYGSHEHGAFSTFSGCGYLFIFFLWSWACVQARRLGRCISFLDSPSSFELYQRAFGPFCLCLFDLPLLFASAVLAGFSQIDSSH